MDVFISYRRDTGSNLAALIETRLNKLGVDCFFDASNIHNEDFIEKIERNIDNAPNFIMILTPGYFMERKGEEDYVRKEILYALEKGKNILAIAGENYNHDEVDWDHEAEKIKQFKTFNFYTFRNAEEKVMEAFFATLLDNMKNQNGGKFSLKKQVVNNSWYSTHEMVDEDFLWIKSDHTVCRSLDWKILEQAITKEHLFDERENLNLLVYKAYDISTYQSKYRLRPRKNGEKLLPVKIRDVYGVTYRGLLQEANETFGEGHFIADEFEGEEYIEQIEELMRKNNLNGFDMIDLTLILKDLTEPEKTLRRLSHLLNPEGGIIYIRELDDDYVDAYPDEKGMIKKLKEFLILDDGAGKRHTGKKIYTFLKRAGADKVYISDEIISTANHKAGYQHAMCDNYFSYLIPELRALAEDTEENRRNSNYQKYVDAYNWLLEYYDDVESLFCSPEFYFRAGYVAGYGVFVKDEELY